MISRIIKALFCVVVPLLVTGCANNSKKKEENRKEIAFSIIKPDVVDNNHIGEVISMYEEQGLRVAGMKLIRLSDQKASEFLAVVKGKLTYNDVEASIKSGPLLLVVVEGDGAVDKNIEIIGASDVSANRGDQLSGSLNKSQQRHAIYWSENPAIAEMDVDFFFKPEEVSGRF